MTDYDNEREVVLYRARFLIRSGGASWSEWRYYEGTTSLRDDLLRAYLDIEPEKPEIKRSGRLRGLIMFRWAAHLRSDPLDAKKVERIFAVQKIYGDMRWHDIQVTFIEPDVILSDDRISGPDEEPLPTADEALRLGWSV